MAFQTSVLRDGEWVTETVNIHAALAASSTSKAAPQPADESPLYGILSRTVIESPVIRWILPVRLRSRTHNDIAFIGDHFVQISELKKDGQAHEILRKTDFGSRIRNAAVVGDCLDDGWDDGVSDSRVKLEMIDSPMDDSADSSKGSKRLLPPQILVLALESGDCVFLFIEACHDGSLKFVMANYENRKNVTYLGYHLLVDPSSRYMAAASPEGVFVVYELKTLENIARDYALHNTFNPVISIRPRVLQGVIHKMLFLHPQFGHDYHVIFILIVVRREGRYRDPVSRMVTYDWALGEDLESTLSEEKMGSRLPDEHRMPAMVIPLRFETAFFAVSPDYIGLIKYSLSGSPEFELLSNTTRGPTELHHGAHAPLWAAWARPFRRRKYFDRTDIIYLAREDGVIVHLEIDTNELVPSVTEIGCLNTNIDTAFATAYDVFSDVLIVSGDAGSGGIWKLAPRADLEQVSTLPNWSPVVDLAVTNGSSLPDSGLIVEHSRNTGPKFTRHGLQKPHRMFSASGRGRQGSVTEWRWGIQGRIGLDIESGEPIRRSWIFSTESNGDKVFIGLLSLPHSTIVLQFSGDLTQVDALPSEDTKYDTTSRTLYAVQTKNGEILQVTETHVAVISLSGSFLWSLGDILELPGIRAHHAICKDDVIILSTQTGPISQVYVMRLNNGRPSQTSNWDTRGEVTCVSLFMDQGIEFVMIGSMMDGISYISIYSLNGVAVAQDALIGKSENATDNAQEIDAHFALEALTSICVVHSDVDGVYFVAGTRCGHLVTARVSENSGSLAWSVDTVGVAPVDVFAASSPFSGGSIAFACCDNNLIMLSGFSTSSRKFSKKHAIWLTDSNDASMPSPPIHSVYSIRQSLSGYTGHMSLMVLSGSRLLFADIWPHLGSVPRNIPLTGTPTRIIYSPTWKCLVVALIQDNKPTLAFIDPDSGALISAPTDKDRNPTEFISGLGNSGDRIFGLCEWLYVKDGKTFAFILVTTNDGRLLIVSLNNVESSERDGTPRKLQYWTRYKKGFDSPIYSIVGDAEGLIFCVGRVLHWDMLDLAEKKLKPVKKFELDSPATSLSVVNGKIFALTTMNSLEVVDHKAPEEFEMDLIHTDQVSRKTVHMVQVGSSVEGPGRWPITLLSDYTGGLAGVWIPWSQRNKEFEVLFEGDLRRPVRRFAMAKSRPLWISANRKARYGVLPSAADGAEALGVSLDGSLQHFTLLEPELWRLLCLLQNLIRRSGVPSLLSHELSMDGGNEPLELEPHPHREAMHIDGDALEQCLNTRGLEKLVGTGDGLTLFCEYIDSLEGGRYTAEFRDSEGTDDVRFRRYFDVGYEVLEYLYAPVL